MFCLSFVALAAAGGCVGACSLFAQLADVLAGGHGALPKQQFSTYTNVINVIFAGLSVFLSCCLPSVLAASAAGVCQACKDPRLKTNWGCPALRSTQHNLLAVLAMLLVWLQLSWVDCDPPQGDATRA